MKAIKVTQTLKDQNKFLENRTVGSWYIGNVPDVFIIDDGQIHGYKARVDLHASHGWKDFTQPTIGENQKLTNEIIESETTATYAVVDLTEEEIVSTLKSQAESDREVVIQERLKAQVVNDAQAIVDDAEALDNSVVYPFWESGISVALNDKYQFFVGTELQLFKVVQAHTTQSDWTPTQVPALFTRVQLGSTILDWVQPTGAQDAYNIGDQVNFEGQVWESTIDANVWSPTAYPAGWTLIN